MALAKSRFSSEAGFSLAEVLVAMGVMAVGLVSLAQLFALSTRANHSSKTTTFAVMLAQQKMEQLRGLIWGFDTLGLPISDLTTNSSVAPQAAGCPASATAGAGTGLSPSPAGTLSDNVSGWVDYLDVNGCLLGGGATAPNRTLYIRRWSVEPLPTNPNNTLILQVLVTRRTDRGEADEGNVTRLPEEARLMSIKTRKYK
jgi:prepilin-type N-terminal cleavage/methylation domain-containing protein